jgi:hypothetical protein
MIDILRAEAEGAEPIVFTFRDIEFTIPPAPTWPLEAMEAREQGRLMAFLFNLFGAEQYKRLKEACKTFADLNEFLAEMLSAMGVDPKALDLYTL